MRGPEDSDVDDEPHGPSGPSDPSPWSAEGELRAPSSWSSTAGSDWVSRAPAPAEANEAVEFAAPRVVDRPDGSDDDQAARSASVRSRRWWFVGLAVLLAGAVVVATVVVTRSASTDDAVADEPDIADEPDVAEDRDVAATEPDASEPPTSPDDASDATTGTTVIELPPAVAAIQEPTEIVMTTATGQLHTLSLPSGRVRTVDSVSDRRDGVWGLMVTPDAAAFVVEPSGLMIVPRVGPPLAVAMSAFGESAGNGGSVSLNGWHRGADGGSVFDVSVYSPDEAVHYAVDARGGVTPVEESGQSIAGMFGVVSSDGVRIRNDAGGAYELAADGTARRIDDGWVMAASGDHRLVRTCDEARVCTVELVTASTGERTVLDPSTLPEDFVDTVFGVSLSPDGQAAAILRDRGNGERALVRFGVGETVASPVGPAIGLTSWAADGSGIFDSALSVDGPFASATDGRGDGESNGLKFTGVDGGEPVVFGAQLGAITGVGVRWPDAEIEAASPVVVTRDVSPASPLESTGIRFVATTRAGALSVIDVDAGVARTWEMDASLGRRARTLFTTDVGVVILPYSGGGALLAMPTNERQLADIFDVNGVKLPGPDTDTVWVPMAPGETGDIEYALLPLTATSRDEALATITVSDAALIGSDGTGGLVLARGGDVFIASAAATTRLTSGELLAINADAAIVRECGDGGNCTLVYIDRQSGQRTDLDGASGLDIGLSATEMDRGPGLSSSIGPGGEVLVAQVSVPTSDDSESGAGSVENTWAFVDRVAGTVTPTDDFDPTQPVIWSPDARFAVFRAGAEIHVYDRSGVRMVALDLEPVVAIGPAPSIDFEE